ncbi:HAMP domain-containing sensor histidine kinase [Chromatium okenii]|uniref:sensor histidine kinase n=1 Tax=Chromatium okenii TaxID=61644 RepID=UPI003084139D
MRLRLWLGAIVSISIALTVAAFGLITLFEHHVERRIDAELRLQLNQLAAALVVASDGSVSLSSEPADPRFSQPLSGLYWQIDSATTPGLLRSRSLWDTQLQLPADPLAPGGVHAHLLAGPGQQPVLVRERQVRLHTATAQPLRLAVALHRAELTAARADFAADMQPYLALIVIVLLLATLAQIHTGLAPLEAVRRGVGAIRSGQAPRLADHYPLEVMPLVSEVNALLAARAEAIERARVWTADLAHGLKTPLTALAADAQRLREQGHPALADDLEQLATAMRRRVDRELIRARVRSGTARHEARVEVGSAIARLLRVLQRTPEGERLAWQVEMPLEVQVALMPDDLLDLLGNLLENAAKWARSSVTVTVTTDAEWLDIAVSDDGAGVAAAQLPRLGERGLRLDQHKEGSGLGLAIVRDIVDAYGGAVTFEAADAGGLLARVRLPVAPREME